MIWLTDINTKTGMTTVTKDISEMRKPMIKVELEPEELYVLISVMRLTLSRMPEWGSPSADMKPLLARIEYLEELK